MTKTKTKRQRQIQRQRQRQRQRQTKTKKGPTCAIFSKSRRFEDIKYDAERGCCDNQQNHENQQN